MTNIMRTRLACELSAFGDLSEIVNLLCVFVFFCSIVSTSLFSKVRYTVKHGLALAWRVGVKIMKIRDN